MADGRVKIDTKMDNSDAKKGIKELKKELDDLSQKFNDVGGSMTAGITAPAMALGGVAIKVASDFDSAAVTIKNGLGVAGDEAERLTDIAANIYKRGFGQSLAETSDALVLVKQNFGDLIDEADLEKVTTQAMTLANTLGEDVGWVARAGTTLMKEFGETSEGAFDLIAWGSQNGLNFSQELLDNIAEYGPLFADMGYSSEEYFALLKEGAKEGAYNLDYINDVMKEFQIRIKDGSEKTKEAMAQLSDSTQQVWQDFLDGKATVKEVNDAVLTNLAKMDATTANMIGVELYGTKWEDLGLDAMYSLRKVKEGVVDADGAVQDMAKNVEESLGNKFQKIWRDSLSSLKPVGETLADIAQRILPPLISGISKLAKWFGDLNPIVQNIILAIGALILILGPLLMSIGFIAAGFSFLMPVITAVGTAIAWLLSPIGMIVVGVIGLVIVIIMYWDQIKAATITVFTAIGNFFVFIWTWIKTFVVVMITAVWNIILLVWNNIKATTIIVWTIIINSIKTFLTMAWTFITFIFTTIWNFIVSIWNAIKATTVFVWTSIVNAIKWYITTMFNIASSIFNAIWNFIVSVWNNIKSASQSAWNWIKSTIVGLIQSIKSSIRSVFNTIRDTIENVWNSVSNKTQEIWDGIVGSIRSAVNTVIDIINGMIGSINGVNITLPTIPDWVPGIGGMGGNTIGFNIPKIPRLDVGTNLVAKSGLAMIHEGEAVVPKEYNPALGNGGAQSLSLVVRIGKSEFKRFVEDISSQQSYNQELDDRFGGEY